MPRKPKHIPRKGTVCSPPFFETPGPKPRWSEPSRDEKEHAARVADYYDWEVRDAIHKAVHTNDPWMRTRLAHQLSRQLLAGEPLTPASREWLSWVLERLIDKDQVPHMARGNAVKILARQDLIERLIQVMQELPDGPIVDRLEKAGKILNASYGKVRALYYSKDFKMWSAIRGSAIRARSKQLPPK